MNKTTAALLTDAENLKQGVIDTFNALGSAGSITQSDLENAHHIAEEIEEAANAAQSFFEENNI